MGTNFYARKRLKNQEKEEIHQKLDNFLSDEITKSRFLEFFEEITKEIHLGKRSCGWQFLWEEHPEYYKNSLDSIKEFLTAGGYEIIDEYGSIYDFQDFIDNEIGNTLYSGYTHESYEKDNPWERKIPLQHHDWISPDGLRFVKGEFS